MKKECSPIDADPHITRTRKPFLARIVAQFPAVLLAGPRQLGDARFLCRVLPGAPAHASLEASDARDLAMEAP